MPNLDQQFDQSPNNKLTLPGDLKVCRATKEKVILIFVNFKGYVQDNIHASTSVPNNQSFKGKRIRDI